MTADDSKEENSVREVGNCVKGSRIRNPVPPPTDGEDVLSEVLGKLNRVLLGGMQSASSVKVVVGFIQVWSGSGSR